MTAFATRFEGTRKVRVESFGKDRAVQSFKDECDVNRIMARYMRTGVAPVSVGVGRYGDFSQVGSFQDAQEVVARAAEQFAALPAKVRDRFKNDPAEFLAFIADKANLDEAAGLGLLSDEAKAKREAEKAAAEAARVAASAAAAAK